MSLGKILSSQAEAKKATSAIVTRRQNAWDLYSKGTPVSAIAAALGVSEPIIYEDIRHIHAEYQKELSSKTGLQHLSEHIRNLEQLKEIIIQQAILSQQELEVDGTGKVISVKTKQPDRETVRLLDLVLKTEQAIAGLKIETGLMGKQPEQLMSSVDSVNKVNKEDKKEKRTPEEIQADILSLLEKGRRL